MSCSAGWLPSSPPGGSSHGRFTPSLTCTPTERQLGSLAWDTFCENYHFPFLHHKTLSDYLVGRRQLVDFYGPHVRMVSALTSIETMRADPEDEWEPGEHISIQYRLYPSVNFSVYPTKLEVHWIYPGRESGRRLRHPCCLCGRRAGNRCSAQAARRGRLLRMRSHRQRRGSMGHRSVVAGSARPGGDPARGVRPQRAGRPAFSHLLPGGDHVALTGSRIRRRQ